MPKYLVASGCSFTYEGVERTWAGWLTEYNKLKRYNYARSSMGNGLIARTAAYGVSKLLQEGVPAEDILVGVMWSGSTRFDFHLDYKPVLYQSDGLLKGHNPFHFIPDATGNWVIGNVNWKSPIVKKYNENFFSEESQSINTFEKILWLQDFLRQRNIKYFMSSYMDTWLDDVTENTKWMSEEIDWSTILCSEFDYLYKNHEHQLAFRASDMLKYSDENWNSDWQPGWHPSADGHRIYTDEIIMPYLRNTYDLF